MLSLSEALVSEAMAVLTSAKTRDELAAAMQALTAGVGLERYLLLSVREPSVSMVFHNAPAELSIDASSIDLAEVDPLATRARSSRIPFAWHAEEGGPWRADHAASGYRAGVAAASCNGSGTSCVLVLSHGAGPLGDGHAAAALAYASLAAAVASGPLSSLAARAHPCPLTERELGCLLFAVAGLSTKETARALGIGARTISQYLERARFKLQVKTTTAAAAVAVRNRWVDVQEALDLAASTARARQA